MKILMMLFLSFYFVSCSHTVVISPDMSKLEIPNQKIIKKNVGYYISQDNYDKCQKDTTGGGDGVQYYPYREIESALQKILFNRFKSVEKVSAMPASGDLKKSQLNYIFLPEIITKATSDSILTWVPTDFVVELKIRAINDAGNIVFEKDYKSKGHADYSEWKENFNLALERGTTSVFEEFSKDINNKNMELFFLKD